MPVGAWDSHMHVTSPDYPLATSAAYKPSLHSLDHAMTFEKTIGINNIVLVQPSIYGNDNSCLLDALKEIGPTHGRGVVAFDPDDIASDTLQKWHRLGVRGVRLNFKSTNEPFNPDAVKQTLRKYAAIVKPLDWVIELFIDLEQLRFITDIMPELGVKFCIAHFGAPDMKRWTSYPSDASDVPGMQHLTTLLAQADNLWVKISAHYRFDLSIDNMAGTEAITKLLLNTARDKMIFASDWPHTRFEGLDVKPFVSRCLDWTEKFEAKDLVFRDNARRLWDCI
ncbi:amidohydrolase, partial [Aureobasidium melanogenum]|uniref:Amidohydrolase n=1 Tax=Aureobasidium melanogenum (strain CBS 110374) TaxID=1043003 RepID=A0A074VI70_AURM1